MPNPLTILAIHGVGRHPSGGDWTQKWTDAVRASLHRTRPDARFDVHFTTYDDVFDAEEITTLGTLEALGKLLGSGIWHTVGDAFGAVFRGRVRGGVPESLPERIRWTAGMIVQWVENESLRRRTRRRVARDVERHQPDVICAHSLGSLVAYDTFRHPEYAGVAHDRVFVSFGSQIGNAFVRGQFGGRIETVDCRHWYHLFNHNDDVFTARLSIPADNFEQVDTPFDLPGPGDHAAEAYLSHTGMSDVVWRDATATAGARRRAVRARTAVRSQRRPPKRALLIGINEYPAEEDRLSGCVNDVFLMSSLLQESGFAPEDIRTVFDDRATAKGIRRRLEWLLDGARKGDERVLFYSGHGAQITDYGIDETVDRKDECLVPWDFDWSPETAITDDYFHDLYSQLAYGVHFMVVLDCCHSGGMTRAGVGRPRGLNPPDDIRHRELRWDSRLQMWDERPPDSPNRALDDSYLAENGSTRRLGRGVDLLPLSDAKYDRVRKVYGHRGPFLPVMAQACQEQQLAYEYRHGVTSYGAFTYSLALELRGAGRRGVSYATLIDRVGRRLGKLGYDQTPNLVGPSRVVRTRIPWGQR